jgi:hypothetical protein
LDYCTVDNVKAVMQISEDKWDSELGAPFWKKTKRWPYHFETLKQSFHRNLFQRQKPTDFAIPKQCYTQNRVFPIYYSIEDF